MASPDSPLHNPKSDKTVYNHHAKQQDTSLCVKDCWESRYSNFVSQSTHPWASSPPAHDVGRANNPTQQTSPLLTKLPPEIKNMIYKLVLTREDRADSRGQIDVSSTAHWRHCHCDSCDRTQDSLLLNCRDVYRDAVGMPFNTELALRFTGTEELSRFMHEMSPRRLQGIRHLVLPLDDPLDKLVDLKPLLRELRKFPRLVRLEVELSSWKLLTCDEKNKVEVMDELEKMVGLEHFAVTVLHDRRFMRQTALRRLIIEDVKQMCRAVPSMRETDPEVKGVLLEGSNGE